MKSGQVEPFALLCGFGDLAGDTDVIDLAQGCELGQDGVQVGDTQLDGLLDYEVHAVFFDRGKDQMKPERSLALRLKLAVKGNLSVFLACVLDSPQPFAIPPIEQAQLRAIWTAQDGFEIVGLLGG